MSLRNHISYNPDLAKKRWLLILPLRIKSLFKKKPFIYFRNPCKCDRGIKKSNNRVSLLVVPNIFGSLIPLLFILTMIQRDHFKL